MPTNKFYVHPGTDFGPGLQGLAGSIDIMAQKKEKEREKERLEDLRKKAVTAFQSGDPDQIAAFAIENPEVAQSLITGVKFKNESTKQNYETSIFQGLMNPEKIPDIVAKRQAFLRSQGATPEESTHTDGFLDKYQQDPEGAIKSLEGELALMSAVTGSGLYEKYKSVTGGAAADRTPAIKEYEYGIIHPEFAEAQEEKLQKPLSNIAKLKEDLINDKISGEDYIAAKNLIINPKAKNKIELTEKALTGDMEAKNILDAISESEIDLAEAKGTAAAAGKIKGLQQAMDLDATAQAVLDGRETIDNVRNTFGVPIQEVVRQKVLQVEPDFNFVQPRAIQKSLSASLAQQQKNRGMMGSFVANINGQVDELEEMSRDVVQRVGVRALDLPWRELKTRFIGSGHENVFEAYMKEISAEINKLSQGSAASIAQLPEGSRREWERIHDVNLSMKQLLIVLNGTREMANIRLGSVQDEIDDTIGKLGDVRKRKDIKDPLGIR